MDSSYVIEGDLRKRIHGEVCLAVRRWLAVELEQDAFADQCRSLSDSRPYEGTFRWYRNWLMVRREQLVDALQGEAQAVQTFEIDGEKIVCAKIAEREWHIERVKPNVLASTEG